MTIEKIISIAEIRAEIASHVYGAELLLQHAMLNINAMERKINQLISERNALAAKLSEIEQAETVELRCLCGAEWLVKGDGEKELMEVPDRDRREPLTDEQKPTGFMVPKIERHHKWCCSNGHGPCDVKQIDFEWRTITDTYTGAVERYTYLVDASSCCGADLMLWDEHIQDFIDFKMVPRTPKNPPTHCRTCGQGGCPDSVACPKGGEA